MKSTSPRPVLHVATSTASPRITATPGRQMSHASAFEGRGRDAGRARYRPMPMAPVARDVWRAVWAKWMGLIFGSRERCAADMGVTFQTACNWFDEFSTPTGDKVMQFSLDYPAEYQAMLDEVAGRKVAA